MNTADLIPRVRETAFIATNAVDYTDARICREMTDVLRSVFSDMVVKSKGGYWLRFDQMTTTVGQPYIRMPARACAGGLHSIQIALDADENYIPLEERNEKQALTYQLGVGQTDVPVRYTLRGDRIVLFPAPNAVYKLARFLLLGAAATHAAHESEQRPHHHGDTGHAHVRNVQLSRSCGNRPCCRRRI
jgi:hypothetical protein